jgi:DNA transformation protein and related proteins
MATDKATVEAIVLAAAGAGDVSARAMFGEYALYCDGKLAALICGGELYVKPSAAGQGIAGAVEMAPPYRGARPSMLIPRERWQDGTWLSGLIRATADALPAPKPKKPRK